MRSTRVLTSRAGRRPRITAIVPTARASGRACIWRGSAASPRRCVCRLRGAVSAQGNKPPRIQHVACRAHARRKLFEVFEATSRRSPRKRCGASRRSTHRGRDHRQVRRPAPGGAADPQPAIARRVEDLDGAQRRRASGKTSLGKALQYALGRWDALARYADDGRLSIDNNVAERLLRGIAVTRKNFLFIGSDQGGERAANLYTLIESAKLNGLDPEAYLAHVIDRLARGHLASKLGELLPWNYKAAIAPKPA